MICTIDPGLRGCGIGAFEKQGVLYRAAYVKNPYTTGTGPEIWRSMAEAVDLWWRDHVSDYPELLLLEVPRIYGFAQRKGDLNDLLELAGVQGAIASTFRAAEIKAYFPRDWKGTVKKNVMTKRIRLALTDAERNSIASSGYLDHNTLDAVGIGLAYFGRLNRRMYATAQAERVCEGVSPEDVRFAQGEGLLDARSVSKAPKDS